MQNKIITILLALFIPGCGGFNISSGSSLDPKVTYDYDLIMTVDNAVYPFGFGVIPFKPVGLFDVVIESIWPFDVVTMDTCSKHLRAERSWNVETKVKVLPFWSRKVVDKSKYRFQYSQDQLERNEDQCQILFQVFNADKGKIAFGTLLVANPKFKLPANVTCNIDHGEMVGTSICKNKKDKFMSIDFNEPVIASPERNADKTIRIPDCAIAEMDKRQKHYKFNIPPKTCSYVFKGLESGELHQLLIIGWEDFIPRY